MYGNIVLNTFQKIPGVNKIISILNKMLVVVVCRNLNLMNLARAIAFCINSVKYKYLAVAEKLFSIHYARVKYYVS